MSLASSRGSDSDHPSPMVRTLVRIIGLWSIGAGLFVFHGIAFHLTPWSQAIVNAIVAYKYPDTGQKDTTVLLFTEENLAQLDGSFPVPYELHARVLKGLSPPPSPERPSPYQPRAVLVDFGFVEKGSSQDIKLLGDAICELTGRNIGVYLALPPLPARPSDDQTRASKIRPELLACAIPVTAQMEAEYGVSGVLEYKDSGNTSLGTQVAPAFAMLPPDLKDVPRKSMEIIWGNGVAPLNKTWLCVEEPEEKRFARLAHRVASFVYALREGPLSVKQTCPYTRTISVGHLLNSDPNDPDPDVKSAVDGKTVFYGGGFLMASDTVVSPVFGELPAVYLHAMAYDNLRTFGANYKRADRGMVSTSSAVDGVLLLLIAAALVVVSPDKLARLPRPDPLLRWLALWLAAAWMVLAWQSVNLLVPETSLDKLLSAVLLIAPWFLVGAFAVLDPATAAPVSGFWGARGALMRRRRAEFRLRCLLTLISVPVAVLMVLAVDGWAGLQAAVLVALLCYFLYKLLVAKDTLFVATALLFVVASVISWLLNVGPRNIVAYLLFFEVARHLITHLDEAAAEYFRLRDQPHAFWDVVFRVCQRNEDEEERHAATAGPCG